MISRGTWSIFLLHFNFTSFRASSVGVDRACRSTRVIVWWMVAELTVPQLSKVFMRCSCGGLVGSFVIT